MIESVIPHPPVGDLDTVNRIRKLAEYVARNGPEFELKVKEKEAGNVAFSFLDRDLNPPGNRFYSWLLFCAKHFYTLDQVDAIETQHSLRIGQASETGSLDLTEEDDAFFRSLLIKNTGSKECIKELRNWFISHSHSASAISFLFIEHMKNLNATCANSQDAGLFKSMLHTVYAINDIMFNSAVANSDGPYTRMLQEKSSVDIVTCLIPQLSHILYLAHRSATVDAERDKIVRVVNIWVTRNFIDPAIGDLLISDMKSDTIGGIAPVRPTFKSPFPQDLPQPNLSPQQVLLQQQQQQLQQQQQQLQQQHSNMQPSVIPLAPSFVYPGYTAQPPPQMPVFRPPPAFSGVPIPAQNGTVPHPFPFQPPGSQQQQLQQVPGFPPNMNFQQQLAQKVQLQMQQLNQFGTFSQQAFAQPPGHPSHLPPSLTSHIPSIQTITTNTPVLDLHKISVGTMANLVKAAIKAGHPRYVPLDGTTIAHVVPPYVEPGRLEARVSEYYRKLEIALGGAPPAAEVPFDAYAAFMSAGSSGADRDRDRDKGSGSAGSSGGMDEDSDRMPRGGKYSGEYTNMPPPPQQPQALTEDNEGHKLLKRMGWQEGSGLGVEGGGIVEPIQETVKKGKTGIGSGSGSAPSTEYSSYRQQLSSDYHSKIGSVNWSGST